MKVRFTIILMLFIGLATLIFTLQSDDVDFDQVKIEDLDKDIQNAIKQIKEYNIYFITKNRTIILYSNLGKSGMYTYPYADIKKKGDKLIVNVKSNMAANDQFVKEILVVRINIKQLPQEIETTFLDKKINYSIINLNN
jgi:hypothetical protein